MKCFCGKENPEEWHFPKPVDTHMGELSSVMVCEKKECRAIWIALQLTMTFEQGNMGDWEKHTQKIIDRSKRLHSRARQLLELYDSMYYPREVKGGEIKWS